MARCPPYTAARTRPGRDVHVAAASHSPVAPLNDDNVTAPCAERRATSQYTPAASAHRGSAATLRAAAATAPPLQHHLSCFSLQRPFCLTVAGTVHQVPSDHWEATLVGLRQGVAPPPRSSSSSTNTARSKHKSNGPAVLVAPYMYTSPRHDDLRGTPAVPECSLSLTFPRTLPPARCAWHFLFHTVCPE